MVDSFEQSLGLMAVGRWLKTNSAGKQTSVQAEVPTHPDFQRNVGLW